MQERKAAEKERTATERGKNPELTKKEALSRMIHLLCEEHLITREEEQEVQRRLLKER